MFSFREMLRSLLGGSAKKRSAFASEREAYDFARLAYKSTGGVTPELQRMFDFYKNSLNDQCASGESSELRDSSDRLPQRAVRLQLRPKRSEQLGEKKRSQASHERTA